MKLLIQLSSSPQRLIKRVIDDQKDVFNTRSVRSIRKTVREMEERSLTIVRTFSGDESFETESPASENSGEMKRRECVWIL